MSNILTLKEVYDAIEKELEHQENKYGKDKAQSLPGYFVLIENELNEAKKGWSKDLEGRHSALAELVQVVALGIHALRKYGLSGNCVSTDDLSTYLQI